MYASTKAHIAYIYDRFPATFCVAPALQNPPIAYHRAARSVSDGGTAELLPRVDVCMNHWPIFIAMRSLWDRGRRSVRDYLLEKGRGDTGKPVETDCLIECLLVVQRYCRNLMFFFFLFLLYTFIYVTFCTVTFKELRIVFRPSLVENLPFRNISEYLVYLFISSISGCTALIHLENKRRRKFRYSNVSWKVESYFNQRGWLDKSFVTRLRIFIHLWEIWNCKCARYVKCRISKAEYVYYKTNFHSTFTSSFYIHEICS